MQAVDGRGGQPRTRSTQRMAERDGAAPGVHTRVVVLQTQLAQHGQALRGKGFIELDHIELRQRQAGLRQHFLRGRRGAYAHDARRHAHRGHAHHAGARRQAVFGGAGFVGQQQRASAVIDAAGIAGRHRAVGAHHAFELGQCFQRGGTRMLVGVHDDGIALFLGNRHGRDFACQVAGLLRGHRIELAGQRHAVLGFALDFEIGGNVFGRLGHRVHAVLFFHQLVNKTPADGGVIHRVAAAESALGLGHHKGRAAHALDAAGNHQARLAGADGAGRRAHGVQARAAQAVEGGARHFQRQAGQQTGHVRHVAIVFTRLVGAAKNHVGDGLPIHLRVARHQRAQRNRAQVVCAHARKRAAVSAEWGADGIANKGL